MKKLLSKKVLGRAILSVAVLGVFILLALGSLEDDVVQDLLGLDIDVQKSKPVNGIYYVEEYHESDETLRTYQGGQDNQGRWHGPVKIELKEHHSQNASYTEEVTFEHGVRVGTGKTTYPSRVVNSYYKNGVCYGFLPVKKTAHRNDTGTKAYQVLTGKYPYFPFILNAFGFEDAYIEAYLDTLEVVLNTYEFEATEFDSYYEDVLDILEETPWDSLLSLQSDLFILQGLEEMKNAEIRLAVVDRYRSGAASTFDVVNSTYPGYLQMLNDSGVTDPDFEQFCQDLEDTLATYGPLDPEDPFFTDSLDTRLFSAMFAILDLDELLSIPSELPLKSDALFVHFPGNYLNGMVKTITGLQSVKAGSADVAGVVVSGMLYYFLRADIIRMAMREAYMINKGIIRLPALATEFLDNTSATSVTIQGDVMEDGGADVTTRGIAWATVYNPTAGDHAEESGTGTGDFTVTVDGLIEGTTYYARTYATNSAGTAYGNCIEFVAAVPSGIQDINPFANDFMVYPNPAREYATFSFRLGSPAAVTLKIIDMKGQVVLYQDQGMMPRGENRIEVDLSDLGNGTYTCQLSNGTANVVRKLEIVE